MRKAGILLPLSSLASPHGIGTLGQQAYQFVDFLVAAGQSLWQLLPIGPTSYGDSPYQSLAAFAGNPYSIDLNLLHEAGLLTTEEITSFWGENPACVDYGLLFQKRFVVLEHAVSRQNKNDAAYITFCEQNAHWVNDYAFYMAVKEAHGMAGLASWPASLRLRSESALQKAREDYADRIEFWRCLQFFFFSQWHALKQYANSRGIQLVGDIPIYVSEDSADFWTHPELFQLGEDGSPAQVAGVPPDGFSADGQLWGNPLYNWEEHQRTGYAWWLSRLAQAASLFDITRIDHFRGFAAYYAIPSGSANARPGAWHEGPGKTFIQAVHNELPHLQLIAEDLGFLTDDVRELLAFSGFPGMKVLQFAFDSREDSDYLPHNYPRHTVVYTGTHDNDTTRGWALQLPPEDAAFAQRYLGTSAAPDDMCRGMVRAALGSVANTAIIPMQDWLNLGSEARFNTPSTLGGGNWCWRLLPGQLTEALAADIYQTTRTYGRLLRR